MKVNVLSLVVPALIAAPITGVWTAAFSGSFVLAIGAFFAGANLTVLGLCVWLALTGQAVKR